MKYGILLTALFLGILVGLTIFSQPEITGSAALNCYAENELCNCDKKECRCGNITMPASYCSDQQKN